MDITEFFRSQIEILDEHLARERVPMSQRAFQAAMIIVEKCIIKIEGDTKDNFLEKRWFSCLYKVADDWFRERYGPLYDEELDNSLTGVIDIYNTPFPISIPITIESGEGDEEGTFWFCLPKEVLSDEDPIKWITNLPNLNEERKNDVRKQASEISSKLREIKINLMVRFPDHQSKSLGTQIIPHLEKSANDLIKNQPHTASLAMWDLFMAVEKSYKALLSQKGSSFKNTHNLKELNKLSGKIISDNELDQFISPKDAIKYRYGELSSPPIGEAMRYYIKSLDLIAKITSFLKRDIIFNNACFLLKAPPWQRQ